MRPGALNSYRWARQGIAAGETAPALPDATYVSNLRRGLDPRQLRDCGYDGEIAKIDDAALAVAVTGGIVTNPAFLDIVDDLLVRASCLCCYYTRSRAKAENAEEQIRLLLGYFSQASYEGSNAFHRVLCGLLRDISGAEADMSGHHVHQGPRDHRAEETGPVEAAARAGVAALNRGRGICAVYVCHAPGTRPSTMFSGTQGAGWAETGVLAREGLALCVYSTPEGRKLLRRLGKACKAAGLTLTTRVATSESYEFFCLRHKLRLYVLECHAPDAEGDAHRPYDVFWACAADAAGRRR